MGYSRMNNYVPEDKRYRNMHTQAPFSYSRYEKYLSVLPAKECAVLRMYFQDRMRQRDIAELYGLKQCTISVLIRRAQQRLRCIQEMPVLPKPLEAYPWYQTLRPIDQDLITHMLSTTCQTLTAKRLAETYGERAPVIRTEHNQCMRGQVRQTNVRLAYIDLCREAAEQAKLDTQYAPVRDLLAYVRDNLYLLHRLEFGREHNKRMTQRRYAYWSKRERKEKSSAKKSQRR